MENQDLDRDVFVLEWTFEPADFFEFDFSNRESSHSLAITPGRVEMRFAVGAFEDSPKTQKRLHNELNRRFQIVQVLNHRPYMLNEYRQHRIHSDGTRVDVPRVYEASGSAVLEVVVTLSGGGPGPDTRPQRWRERIERAVKVSEQDPLLAKLIESYGSAVSHPDHEFVHLYEIRDALREKFERIAKACEALGFSRADWDRFDDLTNNSEIKQGRHRGRSTGNLRPATADELRECREFARRMIMAYLEYVEAQT